MDIGTIKKDENYLRAPSEGYILAFTRKEVIFKKYEIKDSDPDKVSVEDLLLGKDILELHLFDKDIEFRCLQSESRRYKDLGYVAYVEDMKNDKGIDKYLETCFLEKNDMQIEKMSILNHLKYDDNGMVSIDSYRLVMEG